MHNVIKKMNPTLVFSKTFLRGNEQVDETLTLSAENMSGILLVVALVHVLPHVFISCLMRTKLSSQNSRPNTEEQPLKDTTRS